MRPLAVLFLSALTTVSFSYCQQATPDSGKGLPINTSASSPSKRPKAPHVDPSSFLAKTRKQAERGDANAEATLGDLYFTGQFVPQDYAQAYFWYRKAADQGNALAENNVGTSTKDDAEAAVWFLKSAEQGNVAAQMNLAGLYYDGKGVPQDYARAAVWYRDAANQGLADAQGILGLMYERGQGVPQDYAQAVFWYGKSAAQGVAEAQYGLGILLYKGQGTPKDKAQAAVWWRKAAEQGNAGAQARLGLVYDLGDGVPKDYAEAYFWLDIAASGKLETTYQAKIAQCRDETATHLTPADLSNVQERARKWFEGYSAKANQIPGMPPGTTLSPISSPPSGIAPAVTGLPPESTVDPIPQASALQLSSNSDRKTVTLATSPANEPTALPPLPPPGSLPPPGFVPATDPSSASSVPPPNAAPQPVTLTPDQVEYVPSVLEKEVGHPCTPDYFLVLPTEVAFAGFSKADFTHAESSHAQCLAAAIGVASADTTKLNALHAAMNKGMTFVDQQQSQRVAQQERGWIAATYNAAYSAAIAKRKSPQKAQKIAANKAKRYSQWLVSPPGQLQEAQDAYTVAMAEITSVNDACTNSGDKETADCTMARLESANAGLDEAIARLDAAQRRMDEWQRSQGPGWRNILAGAMAGAAGSNPANGSGFLGGMANGYTAASGSSILTPPASTVAPYVAPAQPTSGYTTTFVTPGIGRGSYNTTTTDGSGNYSYGTTYVQPQVETRQPHIVKPTPVPYPKFHAPPPAPPTFNLAPQKPKCTNGIPMISPTKGIYFGCLGNN